MDEARVTAFRTLKPPCVELSQVALRFKTKKAPAKEYVAALERLYETLKSGGTNVLDPKLADYVFFPLSHTFREFKDLPVRITELALQCLRILIFKGWKSQVSSDMGKQLLILLCYLAGGSPTESKVKDVNEELGAAAFECLASLFEATTNAGLGSSESVNIENVPILGHAVTVLLDGIAEGPSVKVRYGALVALEKMVKAMTDKEALQNVFPGIVSSLTKVLSSKGSAKPSYKVVAVSLNVLEEILCKVISDEELLRTDTPLSGNVINEQSDSKAAKPWIEATSSQVKMALANILPLRYHQRPEVQIALSQLCVSILQNCRKSLSHSIGMIVDTLVVLCSYTSEDDTALRFRIEGSFSADEELIEMLKASLHDWIVALPRVMQGNDDTRKQRTINQIATALRILEGQDAVLGTLNESLAQNLRASVSAAIQASSPKMVQAVPENNLQITHILQSGLSKGASMTFPPVLFAESSNRTTMIGLNSLAERLKTLPASEILQQSYVNSLRASSGSEQLANLWLSLQLLAKSADVDVLDQYVDITPTKNMHQWTLDEIYAFSLDVLAKSTFDTEDQWELQALALESVAMQARQQKADFRPELVDALYPILERLGSHTAALQQHAMTCVNIVAQACEYPSPSSLIIDNADYLVNAISLKLNTFSISPQAPQVLVMMIRLCSAGLIPYLDDLVDSIFTILSCYHGYPKLVESLFSILTAMVEEASKAPTSTPKIGSTSSTTANPIISHPKSYEPTSISSLAALLRSNREISDRPLSPPPPQPSSPQSNPSQPKNATSNPLTDPTNEPSPEPDDEPLPPADPPPPQISKTDTLLLKIATSTPPHLTTPSPTLRTHLLHLLTTVLPLLASSNPDTFLPLAATLWDPLLTLLLSSPPDPQTVPFAAETLSTLCSSAGDFIASRIDALWPRLRQVVEIAEREWREERRVMGGVRGLRTRGFEAVVRLVCCVVRDVGVGAEVEDEVFEVLGGVLVMGVKGGGGLWEEVREVLGGVDGGDRLWLVEERGRGRGRREEGKWLGAGFADVVF